MIRLALIYSLALFWMTPSAAAQSCQASPLAVQILGSGGNRVNRDRASASYLVWIAGQGKILVDAGGGAFLRFGQTEAGVANLSLIAISHLHPDHVSDLPALLWSPGGGEKRPPRCGPLWKCRRAKLLDLPQSSLRSEGRCIPYAGWLDGRIRALGRRARRGGH